MPAQAAVLADGVTPIVPFHRAQNGIIFTVKEQVMVDGAHAGGDAEPAVEIKQGCLVAAEIIVAAAWNSTEKSG